MVSKVVIIHNCFECPYYEKVWGSCSEEGKKVTILMGISEWCPLPDENTKCKKQGKTTTEVHSGSRESPL